MVRYFLPAVFFLGFTACGLQAQEEKAAAAARPSKKTVVTADKVRVDTAKKTGVFSGNVVVTDPEFVMTCDEMTVVFNRKENGIEQILAKGQVTLKQLGEKDEIPTIAHGREAVYSVDKGEIVLTGEPSIEQGGSTLTGRVIRFYRNQKKMIVEGGTRLLIYETAEGKKIQ